MRKPTFGLVILVLTILTISGIIAKEFKPLIPPGQPNSMVFESGEFMRQAAYQKVRWHPMNEKAFSEARRQSKPILLLIGTPWSRLGREYDARIFTDVDVAAMMERSFVCIRVDGSIDPYWMNAMAPISRPMIGAVADFQIWFLTPEGKPFDVMLFPSPNAPLDSAMLINRFLNAVRLLKASGYPNAPLTEKGAMHENDLAVLSNIETKGLPDFDAHDQNLSVSSSVKYGGFMSLPADSSDPGFQRLLPNALRFLLVRHEYDKFRAAVDEALRSPYVDWIDGGFFLRSNSEDWKAPQYDKVAVHNAELMQVLALAGILTNDPYYEYLAKRTFDSLATEFMEHGLVRACRIGDEDKAGRSEHSSFPPRILRQLSVNDGIDVYSWARTNLGLRVETNPKMVCMLSDPRIAETQRAELETVLGQLKASTKDRPNEFAGDSLAEVNLVCASKMIYVSRLWGDRRRMDLATQLLDQCNDFLIGSDVVHGLGLVSTPSAYLGDYLSFADAALQDYLANGRVYSLQRGLRVLQRAKSLFQTTSAGVWSMSTEEPLIPNCRQLPEIADTTHESCTARIIRLGNAYGRLLRDLSEKPDRTRTKLASALAQDAYSAMERFSAIAETVGPSASGYYVASVGLLDNTHAFAVGPNAVEKANQLFRRVPSRLVAPCWGDVRPDLQRRKPGYYVVAGGSVTGPLSLDEAAAMLSL